MRLWRLGRATNLRPKLLPTPPACQPSVHMKPAVAKRGAACQKHGSVTQLLLDLSLARLLFTLVGAAGAPVRYSLRCWAASFNVLLWLRHLLLRAIGYLAAPAHSPWVVRHLAGARRWHLAAGARRCRRSSGWFWVYRRLGCTVLRAAHARCSKQACFLVHATLEGSGRRPPVPAGRNPAGPNPPYPAPSTACSWPVGGVGGGRRHALGARPSRRGAAAEAAPGSAHGRRTLLL